MEKIEQQNETSITEFILQGLVNIPEWDIPLFLLFLVI